MGNRAPAAARADPAGGAHRMKKALAVVPLALTLLLPGIAGAAAPADHYANHPIRVRPNASVSPTGLSPATIKSVYSFATGATAAAGRTIAIVDAYDDPTAE